MTAHGSITQWVNQLQEGDRDAARKLWERYFGRMVRLAREKLRHVPRRAADEEDVALGAFDSFCRRAEDGRFPDLNDRDQLWSLLLTITQRKAFGLIQHEKQQKRDWRRTQYDESPTGSTPTSEEPGVLGLSGREPDPEFAAQVAEQCHSLLATLGDAQLRTIALRKMEGYTNAEIAGQVDCAVPTVERRLRVIRKTWEQVLITDEGQSEEDRAN